MLERWTLAVLRARALVIAAWLIILAAGVFAATQLPGLLATSFDVPGTESERARALLEEHFDERPEGTFVVVFRGDPSDNVLRRRLERRLEIAARQVPSGESRELRDGGGILYGEIATRLELDDAKQHTESLRDALRSSGGPRAWVTGQPAIQHDLDPVLASDLRRGEAIAVPLALAVLVFMFGASFAVFIPFAFAACTIAGTLAAVAGVALVLPTSTYVTNLVALIGFALAVDYSLLIVYRYPRGTCPERRPPGRDRRARCRRRVGRSCSPGSLWRPASRYCSSCPFRSSVRWASPACSSRSSRSRVR